MKELKSFKAKKAEFEDLKESVHNYKSRVLGSKAMKAKSKAAAKAAGKPRKLPSEWKVSSFDISQQEVKVYLPPGASIWRANFDGSWQSHLKGHPRHTERWAHHEGSSLNAALASCRFQWDQWLEDNGLDRSSCPIEGLFPV